MRTADQPALFLITGIMAAGKSSVAQALAERFDRSAHVRGDLFRRAIVSGRVEMSPTPSAEALDQLRLRYELAVVEARGFVDAGFVTVMQDIILGPMLHDVIAMFDGYDPHVVVLAPSAEAVARREQERMKTGYRDFTPVDMDAALRDSTPQIGLWVDSTDMTVDQTVQYILDNQEQARIH